MRIGVDFHVVDGKFQGSRTHVIEIFAEAIRLSPDIDFYVFLNDPSLLLNISSIFSRSNVHLVKMSSGNPFKRLYWQLPRLAKKFKLDLLHTQYILPWPLSCKSAVTIHDVLFETHPQFFKPLFVLRSRLLMRLAAKRADLVFSVSEFSKREISRLYAVPLEKISVIHNGADFERFKPRDENLDFLLRRGLAVRGYILSVGRLEPRKNHLALIEAYATLHKPPPLVIVGQRDFDFDDVFNAVDRLGLTSSIHILEDVSDQELPVLYRNAILFAYPAFAEGFGMPPLEAMAAGTPVVTSNTSALPEVIGDAGVAVSPTNVQELAVALSHLLSDADARLRLCERGLSRAALFNWTSSAEVLVKSYRRFFRELA